MNNMSKCYFLIIFLLLCIPAVCPAASGQNDSYEELFFQGIKETREIAADTRLNIDYIPAFVTILQQEQLLHLGIDNVFEAMALVPGVELFMEATGAKQLIFRGVKEKGKVKLMIDGIDINNNFRGSVYYYYDFPIELVKRIEVIRGPGAVLYGSGAMSGVINIVTRSSDDNKRATIFSSASSYDTYKGGMLMNGKINDSWHGAVDGYYTRGNKGIDAGPDKYGAFGTSDESLRDYSVGISAANEQLKFSTRFKHSREGIAFGGKYNFFPSKNDKKGLINSTFFTELQYGGQIIPEIGYCLKAGYSLYEQEVEGRAMKTPTGELISYVDYGEKKLYADMSFISSPAYHEIIAGFRFEDNQEIRGDFNFYLEGHPENLLMPDKVIKPDVSRNISSFYFNDNYQWNELLEFSFGLRYDNYSDIENTINPRVGLVYRFSDQLNFKAMYSRAHRVPSWIELYINVPVPYDKKSNLDSEKSDTVELGFVFNSGINSRLGFNVYWFEINDLIIYSTTDISYTQKGSQNFQGGEFFLHHDFSIGTALDFGLSFVYGKDCDNKKLPDIASWMGNVSLTHTFVQGIISATRLRYVSNRRRAPGDDRHDLDGYLTCDETLSWRYQGLEFIAGIKNIFNNDVRFPAPANTFRDDYPREDRTFIFKISADF